MALVVVCLAQLMMVVDMTIVNVALPVMQRDLRFSQADLTWVVNAYLIAYGSFLLMAGRLGDLVGASSSPACWCSPPPPPCAGWRMTGSS
jgi:MFS family permease